MNGMRKGWIVPLLAVLAVAGTVLAADLEAPGFRWVQWLPEAKSVHLKWTSVPEADYYQVVRWSEGEPERVFPWPGTAYFDPAVQPGRTYRYAVRAVAGKGAILGILSAELSLRVPDEPGGAAFGGRR